MNLSVVQPRSRTSSWYTGDDLTGDDRNLLGVIGLFGLFGAAVWTLSAANWMLRAGGRIASHVAAPDERVATGIASGS